MIGKFGEDYAKVVNMAWMWARLHARTTRLGTFEGGFQAFADLMAKRLQEMGVELKLNTAIQSVESAEGGKVRVVTEQGVQFTIRSWPRPPRRFWRSLLRRCRRITWMACSH